MRAQIRRIAESADPRVVVLDAETSPSIDVTAAEMLADLAHNLRSRGTRLLIARRVGQVRDVLPRAEVPEIVVGAPDCSRRGGGRARQPGRDQGRRSPATAHR